ncbi:MAG: hypothetical protein ACE5NN_03275 [Candidatus Bathyarchaeia archaeon]
MAKKIAVITVTYESDNDFSDLIDRLNDWKKYAEAKVKYEVK